MALNVGDTVGGRYLLVERLGAGGMGVVFRAQDTTLGRDVALKVLLPHVSGNAELIQRFRREARVLAKLRNPGIIVVHDLVTVDGDGTALILEYVAGGSLDDRINEGPLAWPTIAGIGVAAAEALAEAHDAGIVHRDIKPSNILLEPDGGVRIADFGIAQVAGETGMTMQGEAIGTPAYMSPEQAQGAEVGPASDIYSLGAVLFAAATGRTPFVTQEGGFAAALAHITQPVPDPRTVSTGVPDAAAAIIMRAMQKAPADRFASARDLAASLRASADLMSGDIPVATPSERPSEGPPPTLDPAPVADDATRLGAVAPAAVAPAAVAPAAVAPPVVPPPAVPPPAMPPAPAGQHGSLNKILLIGAAAVLALVVVGVLVTLVLTSGSGEEVAEAAPSTSAPATQGSGGVAVPAGVYGADAAVPWGVPVGNAAQSAPLLELWGDFQCPGCAALEERNGEGIASLAGEGRVRLVLRPTAFLDANLGGSASAAAINAWGCAIDAGRSREYYRLIYANQPAAEGEGWTDAQFVDFAEQVGIAGPSLEQFTACQAEGRYLGWAAASTQAFLDGDVEGTPRGYLDGTPLDSAQLADQAELEALIGATGQGGAPSQSPSTDDRGEYSTDFSTRDFGTFEDDLGAALYENGEYIIAIRQRDTWVWSASPTPAVSGVSAFATARFGEFADPRAGEWGITCLGPDNANHYRMGIRTNGSAFISKIVDSRETILADEADAVVDQFSADGVAIQATCRAAGGSTYLALVTNASSLEFTDTDAPLTDGFTGVFGATTTDTDSVAIFTSYAEVYDLG